MRTELVAEIWAALRTKPTVWGDTCFWSNNAIPELERHGVELLSAIESTIGNPDFVAALQSEELVKHNLLHVLLVYFGLADDYGWDSAKFLRLLRGPILHEALLAIFQLWGPMRGPNRRRVMQRALYDAWHALLPEHADWVIDRDRLSRYVTAGKLSLVGDVA